MFLHDFNVKLFDFYKKCLMHTKISEFQMVLMIKKLGN